MKIDINDELLKKILCHDPSTWEQEEKHLKYFFKGYIEAMLMDQWLSTRSLQELANNGNLLNEAINLEESFLREAIKQGQEMFDKIPKEFFEAQEEKKEEKEE